MIFPLALAPRVEYRTLASADGENSYFFEWNFKPIMGINSRYEGRVVGPETTIDELVLVINYDRVKISRSGTGCLEAVELFRHI